VALAHALIHLADDGPATPWRKRVERERALATGTWLLGPAAMRDLGLPVRPPWYGIARFAANLFWSHGVGRFPGGRRVLLRRAERQADLQFGRRGAKLESALP
jgi:hypothetical protein